MPMAASRTLAGTMRIASSAVRITVGNIKRDSAALAGHRRKTAGQKHNRTVSEHARQNRRQAGEDLRAEPHDLCKPRLGPYLGQIDCRQDAEGNAQKGGNSHHQQRSHNAVAESSARLKGRRRKRTKDRQAEPSAAAEEQHPNHREKRDQRRQGQHRRDGVQHKIDERPRTPQRLLQTRQIDLRTRGAVRGRQRARNAVSSIIALPSCRPWNAGGSSPQTCSPPA